jgi:hypothetical protein
MGAGSGPYLILDVPTLTKGVREAPLSEAERTSHEVQRGLKYIS